MNTRPLSSDLSRALSSEAMRVSEIGFSAAPLTSPPGTDPPGADPPGDMVAALHEALDRGVNFIDTAQLDDPPGTGRREGRSEECSERAVATVLRERREPVVVATKTAPLPGPWPPSPYCRWQDRFSAAYLRENVHQRLKRLGLERIDLLQLHTWTRAWNDDPQPLLVLRQLREQGKIGLVGLSAPEHDPNCVVQLMRDGLIDTVQVTYNLFDQEAAAQILPVAAETGTGVLVRAPLDQGSLTGEYSADHVFAENDFRRRYFAGDRWQRVAERLGAIRDDLEQFALAEHYTLADVALKFALAPSAVSAAVVPMADADEAQRRTATAELPDLPPELLEQLHRHNWRRGTWYSNESSPAPSSL